MEGPLEARVAAVELRGAQEAAARGDPAAARCFEHGREVDEEVRSEAHAAVARRCRDLGLAHRFYRVPQDYYKRSLQDRAALLHAAGGKAQLCKSVLIKNVAWDESEFQGPENAEYFLVVVQYVAKLDDDALWRAVRNLVPEESRPAKGRYSFRHATPEEADEICGFEHNAIAPVGLRAEDKVTVVVARAVADLEPGVIFLGGGEVDLKLQVNVEQFIKATGAFVVKCSVPREEAELEVALPAASKVADAAAPLATSPTALPSFTAELEAVFGLVDLRVGLIVGADKHPDSDKLLIEKIDVGDEGEAAAPRQILSGIGQYYEPTEIVGRRVVVVCNLKPQKLGGIASAGMVMCAKAAADGGETEAALKLVEAPPDAQPGARIGLLGRPAPGDPASAAQMKRKKILEELLPQLYVDSDFRATLAGIPWIVAADGAAAVCVADGIPLPASVA